MDQNTLTEKPSLIAEKSEKKALASSFCAPNNQNAIILVAKGDAEVYCGASNIMI